MIILPIAISAMPCGEDRDFMEETYREYYPIMKSAAVRFGSQNVDIDDVISDSCLQLMRHIETLRELKGRQKRMYIISTVRNTAYQFLVKQIKRLYMFSRIGAEEDATLHAPDVMERRIEIEDDLRFVMEMMRKLPQKQMTVLQMKFQMEMTDQDIARETGLSESSVRKYVERGRRNLKTLLGMEG